MARAKTTDRAEARRRYRAQLAAEAAASTGDTEADELLDGRAPASAATPGRRASSPGASPGATSDPPVRMGLVQSLRVAAHPADIPSDLRAFPRIARSTKAVWLPALLILIGGVCLLPVFAGMWLPQFVATVAVVPPPMIPVFLAGMLTARASWLAGGVAGMLAAVVYALFVATAPGDASQAPVDRTPYVATALLTSPMFGVAVGAFAGFYRRFLALSGPPRDRNPRKSGQGSKTASARRR